jgi:UDP-N-acetylmuramoyl-tripeptide--D-alanyl-D-alanine ligase
VEQPLWTADELASITGGSWSRPPGPEWAPTGVRSTVVYDIEPDWPAGAIIFVTRGSELRRVFGDEPRPATPPTGCIVVGSALADHPDLPAHRAILRVPRWEPALQALARAGRRRIGGPVAAVTGTVGKTTTRGMLLHMLQGYDGLVTNPGNGNFRADVIQHVASARSGAPLGVFEVGLGAAVDAFRTVSQILEPDVVVLTQLGIAHLDTIARGDLSHEEALLVIAEQKLQLCENMAADGAVVVRRDIPVFAELERMLFGRRIITFGEHEASDYRLIDVDAQDGRTHVRATAFGAPLEFDLGFPGRFMAFNGLGALATANEMTGDLTGHAASLASFEAVEGRARILPLTVRGNPITLIDDSYNATPLSVRSTFELLRDLRPGPGGRRIAVLGDIAHLGAESAATHAALADDAQARGVDRVFTLGRQMAHMQQALPARMAAGHFVTKQRLVDALLEELRAGDVVTVKASVPLKFGTIVQRLQALDGSPDPV